MKSNLDHIKSFSFIILIISIIMPFSFSYEAKAESVNAQLKPIKSMVDSTYVQLKDKIVGKALTYTFDRPNGVNRYEKVAFQYDLSLYSNYDYVTFTAYVPSKPVVTLNQAVCSVYESTNSHDMNEAFNGYIGIVCPNSGKSSWLNFNFGTSFIDQIYLDFYIFAYPAFYGSDEIITAVEDIKEGITSVEDKVGEVGDKITDAIEGDNLDTDSIESSKNDSFEEYKNSEGNLNLDGADLSGINLGLNPVVASRSWATLQTFLDVNPKLMTFVISMLSIGLIKLFLGR